MTNFENIGGELATTPSYRVKPTWLNDNYEALATNLSPIGCVMAWLKDLTNTPTLPANWVECNGQTINDADSPYNGITIPNLNNDTYLKGKSSSGTTGGSNTINLAHTHSNRLGDGATGESLQTPSYGFVTMTSGSSGLNTAKQITTSSLSSEQNNEPSHYTVIWIMRVK